MTATGRAQVYGATEIIKEHFTALTSAGVDAEKAIEATDAMAKIVNDGIVRQQVTQWAVLAILGMVIAIAVKVFAA